MFNGKGGELQPFELHDIYEQTGVFTTEVKTQKAVSRIHLSVRLETALET